MRNGKPKQAKFEHVWFAYKDDDYVIKDLNFTIHPGEKVALVGPTGAGKSSIIRLLPPLRTQPGSHSCRWHRRPELASVRTAVPHGVFFRKASYLPGM